MPLIVTVSEVEPGSGDTTSVHGTVAGVGGCKQPTIGAPTKSTNRRTGAPWASTWNCFGINVTCPPCEHINTALVVRSGGIKKLSIAAQRLTALVQPSIAPGP